MKKRKQLMGNQSGKLLRAEVLDQLTFKSCHRVANHQNKLLLSNPISRQLHLLQLNKGKINQLSKINSKRNPLGVAITERYLAYGDNMGVFTVQSRLNQTKQKTKLADGPINQIEASSQRKFLVGQQKFLSLVRVRGDCELRVVYKQGFTEPLTKFKPLSESEAAIGTGKVVQFYDVERQSCFHSYINYTKVLGLAVPHQQSNTAAVLVEGRGYLIYDKRMNYCVHSRQCKMLDASTIHISDDVLVFGGEAGALELVDLRQLTTMTVALDLHKSSVVGLAANTVSCSKDGQLNLLSFV